MLLENLQISQAQYKPALAAKAVKSIAKYRQTSAQGLLLLGVLRLSTSGRKSLREAGVSWIERETGICFILGPGILVDRQISVTHRVKRPDEAIPQLRERAGLVAEALLDPHRLRSLEFGVLADDLFSRRHRWS